MDIETDAKLFAAALYVITDMWGKEMGDLQRASLANQIIREIERRGIFQPAAAAGREDSIVDLLDSLLMQGVAGPSPAWVMVPRSEWENIERLFRSRLKLAAAAEAPGAERVDNKADEQYREWRAAMGFNAHRKTDAPPPVSVEEMVGRLRWWLGAQNDGLFIINQQPRHSNDDQFHERTDGPSFAVPLGTINEKHAQAIIDEHNRILTALAEENGRLREALRRIADGEVGESSFYGDFEAMVADLHEIARAALASAKGTST